jgi:hypothetical protein
MEKNLPQGYPLYDSVYGSEIPSEQYYVHLFDILPSRYSTQKDYNNSVSEFILSNGFEKESYVYNLGRRHDSSNQTLYVKKKTTKKISTRICLLFICIYTKQN